MNKKWIAVLIAICLFALGPSPCPGGELGEDIGLVADGIVEDIEAIIDALSETSDPESLLALKEVDWEAINENLLATKEILESEETQELLAYTKEHAEVQELIYSMVEEAITFMNAEPELSRDILEAMQLDPIYLNIFDTYQKTKGNTSHILQVLLETKEGKEFASTVEEYIGAGNFTRLVELIAEQESAPLEGE